MQTEPLIETYSRLIREKLPPPLAELAVSRLDHNWAHERDYPYCFAPIHCGFRWGETPEGYSFWRSVESACLYDNFPLPSLKNSAGRRSGRRS